MTEETVRTLLWVFAIQSAVNGVVIYSVVRLFISGRVFEKREQGPRALRYEREADR